MRAGHMGVALLAVALVGIALVGGWIVTLLQVADYTDLQAENRRLESYRDKVRHVILDNSQYGLIGVDLLRELELSIDLEDDHGEPLSILEGRRGGIFIDQIYINFLENIPTFPPVNGYVTRGLQLHELDLQVNHEGIDIAAPAGGIVAAAASGLVVFSRWTEDLGYMIILSHGDGYFTVYGHNQTNLVSARQWVERGEPIALVGDTGISQGPHLHFEIWKDARSIDPRLFIDLYRTQDVSVETHG
ncbi:MAG: M23 family metallopeptidase [Candidatus Neomarinimicrobiota bacterium]